MMILEWVAWEIFTLFSATLGTFQLDTFTISQQYLFIFFQVPLSVGIAGTIYSGHFLGANKPAEAINATRVYQTLIFSVGVSNACMIYGFSSYLPMALVSDQALINEGSRLLKFAALVHVLGVSCFALTTTLRTLGKQFIGSVLALVSNYVFGVPIGLALLLRTGLENYGVFISWSISLPIMMAMEGFVLFRIDWVEYAQKVRFL